MEDRRHPFFGISDVNSSIEHNKLIALTKKQARENSVFINIMNDLATYGLGISKLIPSPILGGSGNKEFLCLIERNVKALLNVIEAVKE